MSALPQMMDCWSLWRSLDALVRSIRWDGGMRREMAFRQMDISRTCSICVRIHMAVFLRRRDSGAFMRRALALRGI